VRAWSRARGLLVLERSLFGVAFLGLGAYLVAQGDSSLYATRQDRRLDHALREGAALAAPSLSTAAAASASHAPRRLQTAALPEGLVGRLEAPRLGLSVVVAEGIDARTLRRTVGHVPGTALPGQPGNVALAGHRDLAFRRLRGVRVGDMVRLVTPSGRYEYVVESAEVVGPERGDLLAPTPEPTLTLVTCYPFFMVGPAPQRFVVRARLATSSAG
jgi:LPXTG-site transpeptidase (sortase) family protein